MPSFRALLEPVLEPVRAPRGLQKSTKNPSKNQSFFLIDFTSILVPIMAPILDLLGAQIGPNLIQQALQSLFISKTWIFTKTFKNQWNFMIFHSKMDPKTTQDQAKTAPRRSQRPSFFIVIFAFEFGPFWPPFWSPFGSLLDPKIGSKSIQKHIKIMLGR